MTLLEQAQRCDLPVLITGETGVGKEVLADQIQAGSKRSGNPYVKVNCAALPENLVESMLFGHKKGSFTGATEHQTGKFEQANGGTIMLDEIGDLPLLAQAKLLRVTQDGSIEKLGGGSSKVNVRLISVTNKDLQDAAAARIFRLDLYYRLAVLEIKLLPLRNRLSEILPLAHSFTHLEISPEVERMLLAYHWPGNIRELQNVIQRAELGATSVIKEIYLKQAETKPMESGLRQALKAIEKEALLDALEKSNYVQSIAAQLLKVPPKRVNDLIKLYNIRHHKWRKNREGI